jgi:hypothetical protein
MIVFASREKAGAIPASYGTPVKISDLTVTHLTELEKTGGLERAVDNNFRRLVEQARRHWEQKFAEKDPSDACVTVHVASETVVEHKPVPGSGFVKSSKKFEQRSNISLPRYAQ